MELRKNQEGQCLGCPLNHCSISAVLWAHRSAAELCVRDCLVSPWTLRFCQLCQKGAGVCGGWGGCWGRNAQCLESCEYFWCSVPPSPPASDFVIPWKNTDSCNEADLRMVSYINCKHFYLLHLNCSFPFQPSTLLFRVRGERTLQQVCCELFPMDVLRTVEDSGYQCSDEHWCRGEWRLWWGHSVQDEKIHSWVISRCQTMHFIWSTGKISSVLVD